MYDDEYPTCARTYATLSIANIALDEVTKSLGIDTRRASAKQKAWLLPTKDVVQSKDFRRHLDWLLDFVDKHRSQVRDLIARGAMIKISCYWLSASGHGGPMVSAAECQRLGDIGIGLDFDFYGPYPKASLAD
jgi:hypothetical protein